MPKLSLALLLIYVFGLTGGQILFKRLGVVMAQSGVWAVLRDPTLYLALALYGAITGVWIFLLSREPISRVYPATALCYILVPLAGVWLWSEKLDLRYALGLVLLIAGTALIVLRRPS